MTSVVQVYAAIVVQMRLASTRHATIARFGKMQVKFGQQFHRHFELLSFAANLAGEDAQDTLNLLPLLDLQLPQPVVELYHHYRLDKHRGSTGGLVVNDTTHLPT